MELFPLVQILYWLSLSTWFGSVLFIAIATPIIFRTIKEHDPMLPMVLSVNLEGQHATLLAGSIIASLLKTLLLVQVICAAGTGVAIAAQWFYIDLSIPAVVLPLLRTALFIASAVLLVYDWRVVTPKMFEQRQTYIDHADEPDIANAAKDLLDRHQREGVWLMTLVLMLLLGVILFSGNISPNASWRYREKIPALTAP